MQTLPCRSKRRFAGVAAWIALSLVCVSGPRARGDDGAQFVRGYNLGGPPLEIDGRRWEGNGSSQLSTSDRQFDNQSVPLNPPTDPARTTMIRSSRWNTAARMVLANVPAGRCQVCIYVWEDNNSETFSISLQGAVVEPEVVSGGAGDWKRLGPYAVDVEDSRTVTLTTAGGAANLSGIEIWSGSGAVPAMGTAAEEPLPPISAAQADLFRTHIAPLFSRHCLECHSTSAPQGGLNLSRRAAAVAGGDSGALLTPGKPEESLLWTRVVADEMPHDRPPLSSAEKERLREWIAGGAGWADRVIDPFLVSTDHRAGYDWWSLQPVRRPPVPPRRLPGRETNDVDAFLLDRLEASGLTYAPEADPRTLIRRITFDLTGLPPTPEEIAAFTGNNEPRAYARLVDRLLESPHYGERWARHWLDVIRFGESQGYERNRIRDNAWRYRDWVVEAFNDNLPYDEFVRLQLAGDVLHPKDLGALIATGYHVCGTWDQVGHIEGSQEMRKAVRQDHLEDLVGVYGQAFLGLTLNCARCHDHKFDPVFQEDYYRIAAALAGVHQQEKEREGITLTAGSPPSQQSFTGQALVSAFEQPAITFVLMRGDYRTPQQAVAPAGLAGIERAGFPADLGLTVDAPEADRRRALAAWTTDPRNPLTARVFVNRVWRLHFGEGIVDTPSDFGYAGGRPSHADLLDHLAGWFMETGWDVKALHRLIVNTAAYKQRSRVVNVEAEAVDADNRLLWRANRRRLEGEAVRDSVLAISGALNPRLGGPSFRDVNVKLDRNHEFTTPSDEFSPETCRRTIYRLWARSGNHPLLSNLDCPDPTVAAPQRTKTITPLQALSLMNSGFMEQCAASFAVRIAREAGDDPGAQVTRAWTLALQRPPDDEERKLAVAFVTQHGLAQLGITLFNTNEFLHAD